MKRTKRAVLLFVLVVSGFVAAQDDPPDLAAELRQTVDEIEVLVAQRDQTPAGDERDVINTRIARHARTLRADFGTLMSRIENAAANGGDASADRALAEELLDVITPIVRREIDHRVGVVDDFHRQKDAAPEEARLDLAQQITRDNQDLDQSMSSLADIIDAKNALSLDSTADEAYLDRVLEERVDDLSVRTELTLARREEASQRLRDASDEQKADIESELRTIRESLHGEVASLEAMVALLDERGLDSNEPKELLFEATGNVTTDIFDWGFLSRIVTRGWGNVTDWLVTSGPQLALDLLFFALIIAVFWVIGRVVRKVIRKAFERTSVKAPTLLKNMVVSLSGKLILVLGIIIALPQIGIDIGPLLAGVGVAGFIVGFALQDTLSNFASGVMILLYQPFDVGDVVEAGGVAGEVSYMSVVSTTIRTFDNQVLIVPNNKIWGDVIRNKTAVRTRRVDLTFGISYSDDVVHAEHVLHDIVASHESVLDDPAPTIRLHELADSSVNFVVRPWVKTEDYWNVYWDITRAVKQRFDAEGISIPFPQRDVHVSTVPTNAGSPEPVEKPVESGFSEVQETVPSSGVSGDED